MQKITGSSRLIGSIFSIHVDETSSSVRWTYGYSVTFTFLKRLYWIKLLVIGTSRRFSTHYVVIRYNSELFAIYNPSRHSYVGVWESLKTVNLVSSAHISWLLRKSYFNSKVNIDNFIFVIRILLCPCIMRIVLLLTVNNKKKVGTQVC